MRKEIPSRGTSMLTGKETGNSTTALPMLQRCSRRRPERIRDQKSLNPVKLIVPYAIGSEETWQKLETREYLMVSALERPPWEGVLVDRLVREELQRKVNQIRIYYNSLERSDNQALVPRMDMEKWLSQDSLGQSWWNLMILLDALGEEDDPWVLGLFLFPVVGCVTHWKRIHGFLQR